MKIIKKYYDDVWFRDILDLINTPNVDTCEVFNTTLDRFADDIDQEVEDYVEIRENKDHIFDIEKEKLFYLRINSAKKKAPLKIDIKPLLNTKNMDYKFFI